MIDRPHTGPCARRTCPHRAIRGGVCLTHWRELMGDGLAPWPEDIKPKDGNEYRRRKLAREAARR